MDVCEPYMPLQYRISTGTNLAVFDCTHHFNHASLQNLAKMICLSSCQSDSWKRSTQFACFTLHQGFNQLNPIHAVINCPGWYSRYLRLIQLPQCKWCCWLVAFLSQALVITTSSALKKIIMGAAAISCVTSGSSCHFHGITDCRLGLFGMPEDGNLLPSY